MGANPLDEAAPSEDGRNITIPAGVVQNLFLEGRYPRIAGEVGPDKLLRLLLLDAQPLGQAERTQAVNHAEVDRLGVASLLGRHLALADPVDLPGHEVVDVAILLESPLQLG